MNNVLLGKVIKAMYKLSGKTLVQLSDETGLTVDTLNNLFYARLQKPGFFGVETLVEATGYTIQDLLDFMKIAETLPEDADITEEFTKFLFSAKEKAALVDSTKSFVKPADEEDENLFYHKRIQEMNEEHERQLDRFRATHLHYVDELHARYQEQILQMQQSTQQLKAHYDHSVGEIKKSHQRELESAHGQIKNLQRIVKSLVVALVALAIVGGILCFILKGPA